MITKKTNDTSKIKTSLHLLSLALICTSIQTNSFQFNHDNANPLLKQKTRYSNSHLTKHEYSRQLVRINLKSSYENRNDRFSTFLSSSASPSLSTPSSSKTVKGGDYLSTNEDTDEFEEESSGLGAWIPIASASSIYGLGPTSLTVMGERLVVWYEDPPDDSKKKKRISHQEKAWKAKWSVLYDYCPHRLAPLSQGRVDPETNCIECPYHGWQFDTDGKVTSIPQLEQNSALDSKANAKGLPVHLAGDLIFAFLPSSVHGEMQSPDELPEDTIPWLPQLMTNKVPYFVRDLPYSTDFLIENFMDPAHIPYAHHSLQSVRSDGSPIKMKQLEYNFTHLEVLFQDISRNKTRHGVLSFQRPTFYHFRTKENVTEPELDMSKTETSDTLDYKINLGIFLVPISAGKSRVFLKGTFATKLPRWLIHAASNRFLNTDTWLHDAEFEARKRNVNGEEYIYKSQSDLAPNVFRKWWREFGFSQSPPNTFGPSSPSQLPPVPIPRNEQIDPWDNHAKNCYACRKALQRMKQIQVGALIFAVASLLFFPVTGSGKYPLLKKVGSLLGAGFGFWLRNFTRKFATVIEGNPRRSELKERSVSSLAM